VIQANGQVFDGNGNPVSKVDTTFDIHDDEVVPQTISEVHELLYKDAGDYEVEENMLTGTVASHDIGTVEHAIAIVKLLAAHPAAKAWVVKRNPR
jgi:hypothetical protein